MEFFLNGVGLERRYIRRGGGENVVFLVQLQVSVFEIGGFVQVFGLNFFYELVVSL